MKHDMTCKWIGTIILIYSVGRIPCTCCCRDHYSKDHCRVYDSGLKSLQDLSHLAILEREGSNLCGISPQIMPHHCHNNDVWHSGGMEVEFLPHTDMRWMRKGAAFMLMHLESFCAEQITRNLEMTMVHQYSPRLHMHLSPA